MDITKLWWKETAEKVEDIVARIHVLEADISASLEKLFAEEK